MPIPLTDDQFLTLLACGLGTPEVAKHVGASRAWASGRARQLTCRYNLGGRATPLKVLAGAVGDGLEPPPNDFGLRRLGRVLVAAEALRRRQIVLRPRTAHQYQALVAGADHADIGADPSAYHQPPGVQVKLLGDRARSRAASLGLTPAQLALAGLWAGIFLPPEPQEVVLAEAEVLCLQAAVGGLYRQTMQGQNGLSQKRAKSVTTELIAHLGGENIAQAAVIGVQNGHASPPSSLQGAIKLAEDLSDADIATLIKFVRAFHAGWLSNQIRLLMARLHVEDPLVLIAAATAAGRLRSQDAVPARPVPRLVPVLL